jgi:hypothetical protein
MLQPDTSFHVRIPRERYEIIRGQIREKFDDIYQAYEHQNLEAYRFILPLRHSDPPVEWFNAEEFAETVGGYYIPLGGAPSTTAP